jgi:hypothetical protein
MKNGDFWVVTRATRRNNPEDTILHGPFNLTVIDIGLFKAYLLMT